MARSCSYGALSPDRFGSTDDDRSAFGARARRCEQLLRVLRACLNPALEGRPVVVLSNNDGCVVARSNEVKALGVKMAAPWFMLHELAERHQIIAYSSNYTLYDDMSRRVMTILADMAPRQERWRAFKIPKTDKERTVLLYPPAQAALRVLIADAEKRNALDLEVWLNRHESRTRPAVADSEDASAENARQ